MRHGVTVLGGLLAVGLAAGASAQQGSGGQAAGTIERRAEVEGTLQASGVGGVARFTIESRVTTGAPYSAEARTEFNQILPDGNRISRTSVTRTFRDSEGRTRREQSTIDASGAERVTISVFDPVAHTSFILDPQERTARRQTGVMAMPRTVAPGGSGAGGGRGSGGGTATLRTAPPAAPTVMPAGHDPAERRRIETEAMAGQLKATSSANTTTESLGQQFIDGVMAEGTRTTTTIPAGAIGNAQPIRIVAEQWFSPDLQVLVMTRHSDPRTGETTYRLGNIVRGEQDRSLFEIPADYTVKEPGIRRPMEQ